MAGGPGVTPGCGVWGTVGAGVRGPVFQVDVLAQRRITVSA